MEETKNAQKIYQEAYKIQNSIPHSFNDNFTHT